MLVSISLTLLAAATPNADFDIACVGDSITVGARLDHPARHAWPAQLRARLEVATKRDVFHVTPCAIGGSTLLREGDRPIWATQAFGELCADAEPTHAVVLLGTNDTVAGARGNWAKAGDWESDIAALVDRIRGGRTEVPVLLVGPPPIFPAAPGLSPERVRDLAERAPRSRELAERSRAHAATLEGVEHLDLEGILRASHVVDGVHPDPFGQEAIARAVHRALASSLDLVVDERDSLVPAPSAEYRGGAGWQGGTWWDAFERLEALGRAHADARLVFLGDSITQGLTGDAERVARPGGARAIDRTFGADGAISLGLSGDRTEHLRYRVVMGALRGMHPRVIVLQIGINNLNAARHASADVSAGIRAVVTDLRATQPWATILVCGPFPAGRTADAPLRRAVDDVHARIASIGEGTESPAFDGAPQVRYLDLRDLFLNDDGTPGAGMAGDALHVTVAGRVAWMEAIEPHVRAELDRTPAPGLPAELGRLVFRHDYVLLSRRLATLAPGG